MSFRYQKQRDFPLSQQRDDILGIISKLQDDLNSTIQSHNILLQQHTEIEDKFEQTKHNLELKSKELEKCKKIASKSQIQNDAEKDRIIAELKSRIQELEKENQQLKSEKAYLLKANKKSQKRIAQNEGLINMMKEQLADQEKELQNAKTRDQAAAVEKIVPKVRPTCSGKIEHLLLLKLDADSLRHLDAFEHEMVSFFQNLLSCREKTPKKIATEFIAKYPQFGPFTNFQEKLLLVVSKYLSDEKSELFKSQLDSVATRDQELQEIFFQIRSGNATEEVEKLFDIHFPAYLMPLTDRKIGVVALMKKSIKDSDFSSFNSDVNSAAANNPVRAMFHTLCADGELTVGNIVKGLVKKQKYKTDGFFWNWRSGFW